MRAIVQRVDETVVAGRTSIRFGTLTPLGVNDLSDILRMARARVRLNPITMRSGQSFAGNVTLGKKTPTKNSQSGLPHYEELHVSTPSGSQSNEAFQMTVPGQRLFPGEPSNLLPAFGVGVFDPTGKLLTAGNQNPGAVILELARAYGKTIRLRQLKVCNDDGTTSYVLGLFSKLYDSPVTNLPVDETE